MKLHFDANNFSETVTQQRTFFWGGGELIKTGNCSGRMFLEKI